ncbi:MAG: DNA repair protein RadC [Oscillospiraceae bacterium]|nr:DNA repair protein RadC [Oscillospiraceae bacterium]
MDMTGDNLKNTNSEMQVEGNVVKLPSAEKAEKPKNKPKNVHAGHRQRLRKRFLENGLDSFEDHNALELFLFYAIPNRDVNDLAHDLINEFGSLSAVFDARFEDLCKVKGISEYSASLIKLLPALARRYEQVRISAKETVYDSPEKIAEYMSGVYFGVNREEIYIVCLDSACRLLKCINLGMGEIDKVSVSYRNIAEQVFSTNAANVIVVHNHVSGIVAPSPQDIIFTSSLVTAMKGVGIRISDHIIMGNGKEHFSMRQSRKWGSIFRT